MKRFPHFLTGALAVMVLGAGLLQAQPRMAMRGGPERVQERKSLVEELGLSSEQQEKIRQIRLAAHKQNIEQRAKLQLARLELHELMQADSPDQKQIDAKIAELGKLREAAMRSHVATFLEVQKVLTPEQRKKAKELRPLGLGPGFFGPGFGRRHDGPGMGRGLGGPHGRPGMWRFEDFEDEDFNDLED
ncbi:MAG: Spy/CpxP family protein refolding chaperone [candidate division KSB1 bacterium]|nr:Spy/CpxP family protein refolding chaperone [candidate division KSB1 bacterium]MDZ7275925.1 Spy/CpxP family protein refolding chaperone [candidate division KSB1 bacterium]MDZ7285793.1 Spy/CpxP family protein refolding chaperone [candidate division KSB1 bacterium]MDZ7298825.1 Spy/CpxP family protein refolding chaperone [candidate division KSB1 bacterium]MDZ7308997.1 Spy/CpxP family protein refolding chaperone [candidate division KSB1 bacterium]